MRALTTVFLSAVIAFMLIFTVHGSHKKLTNQVVLTQVLVKQNLASNNGLASQIYSAAFNDISPGYDDLYVIKTQDKGREIIIYCNATYCYKNRNSIMTS